MAFIDVPILKRESVGGRVGSRHVVSRPDRSQYVMSIVIVDGWARMIFEKLYILYIMYAFHSIYENKNDVITGNYYSLL